MFYCVVSLLFWLHQGVWPYWYGRYLSFSSHVDDFRFEFCPLTAFIDKTNHFLIVVLLAVLIVSSSAIVVIGLAIIDSNLIVALV